MFRFNSFYVFEPYVLFMTAFFIGASKLLIFYWNTKEKIRNFIKKKKLVAE